MWHLRRLSPTGYTTRWWCRFLSGSPGDRRVRVYTKTGDRGESSLFNRERRRKDDEVFEALGTVDELSATLGVARTFCKECGEELDGPFHEILSRLVDVGSALATPRTTSPAMYLERTAFAEDHVTQLEQWIDTLDQDLPPLHTFILPGGGQAGSFLHMTRALCRRAERRVVPLVARGDVDAVVGRFLNRLSDFLFVAARKQLPNAMFGTRALLFFHTPVLSFAPSPVLLGGLVKWERIAAKKRTRTRKENALKRHARVLRVVEWVSKARAELEEVSHSTHEPQGTQKCMKTPLGT